jgi:predicted nuclease of predicted toxin-antitoxin system
VRFLADESFAGVAVRALRALGHDVVWVREQRPGVADDGVLAWAAEDKRVLLTFDKDFGELVYRRGREASCGVVLFRIPMASPEAVRDRVLAVISARDDWQNVFSVVDERRIRMRPLG